MKNIFKDFIDVKKYRIKASTIENKLNARNKDYILALETTQTLVIQNVELQKQVEKLKEERKELKRIINEDMTPKKKKKW